MLITTYFVVIGIRGGFGKYTRPITISNALQYTNTPRETAIVLNTPFSLMKSLENETYVHPHYMSNSEMERLMTPIHKIANDRGQMSNDNVVILILESFGKEYMDAGYTPFLDSLFAYSKTYRYSYASGRKSIDAMPSVLSSIPMLIEPFIVTPYSTNQVSSIADCLGREGYSTAFFHGAPNGSMGFQAYARAAGFDTYYGMDDYDGPEAFDGTWAIWDEEFLQYYARTMSRMHEPFMTAVFTASSHHPFRVPKRYEGVFPQGSLPIHQCIGYSDYALRQFFNYGLTTRCLLLQPTIRTRMPYQHTITHADYSLCLLRFIIQGANGTRQKIKSRPLVKWISCRLFLPSWDMTSHSSLLEKMLSLRQRNILMRYVTITHSTRLCQTARLFFTMVSVRHKMIRIGIYRLIFSNTYPE